MLARLLLFRCRCGGPTGGRVPVAGVLFLGVHHDVGGHDADDAAGRELRGNAGDADVHHRVAEHAGAVRHRRVQAARAQHDAGPDAPRVLARRPPANGPRALLAVRAHVRDRHARGQHAHVHGARGVGGQPRQH